MSGKYDNAFPKAQKVQIFEQVETYIENNHSVDDDVKIAITELRSFLTDLQAQHPTVTTETQALAIIDAEFTALKQSPTSKLITLRQQILNPERHTQAMKATLIEVINHFFQDNLLGKAFITYLNKMSETPNTGD